MGSRNNKEKWTEEKLKDALKLMRNMGLSMEARRAAVCRMVGHSRIVNVCFGQVTCARCDEILGDTLAGSYYLDNKVIVDHRCRVCNSNFENLPWQSTVLVPRKVMEQCGPPFPEAKDQTSQPGSKKPQWKKGRP